EPRVRLTRQSVDELIREATSAEYTEGEADTTGDLKNYALDEPALTVTLVQKDADRQWKLNIGKASIGGSGAMVYVNSSDRPKEVLAVRRSTLAGLFKNIADDGTIEWKTLIDYRDRDLLTESSLNISYVKLDEPKHDPIILAKTEDAKWRFERPAYGEA